MARGRGADGPVGRLAVTAPVAALRRAALQGAPDVRLARLEALLDPVFLAEIGWNKLLQILTPPMDHRLLGWPRCAVPRCHVETSSGLCTGCMRRQQDSGLSMDEFIDSAPPKRSDGAEGRWMLDESFCSVEGCERPVHTRTIGLCNSHSLRCRELFGRITPDAAQEFLARPEARPLRGFGACRVAACLRTAYGSHRLCLNHAQHWHAASRASADFTTTIER